MQYHVTTSSSNAVNTQFELNKGKLKTIAVSLVLSKPAMTKQKNFSFTGIFKRTIARVTHYNRLKKRFKKRRKHLLNLGSLEKDCLRTARVEP